MKRPKFPFWELNQVVGRFIILGWSKHNKVNLYTCKCTKCDIVYKKPYYHIIKNKCMKCYRNSKCKHIGKKIGGLTILKYIKKEEKYLSVCDCGRYFKINGHLNRNNHTQCKECKIKYKIDPLIGEKFGTRTVKKYIRKNKWGHYKYLIKCTCGHISEVVNSKQFKEKPCKKCFLRNIKIGSKLTYLDVKSIRELIKLNIYTIKELHEMFGVSETSILRIKNRKRWRYLQD